MLSGRNGGKGENEQYFERVTADSLVTCAESCALGGKVGALQFFYTLYYTGNQLCSNTVSKILKNKEIMIYCYFIKLLNQQQDNKYI